MLHALALGSANDLDAPVALVGIGVSLVAWLVHCQRQHVRRRVAARHPRR